MNRSRIAIGVLALAAATAFAGPSNVDPTLQYAWGENIGWANFLGDTTNGVVASQNFLEGYAWCENVGWLFLGDCHPYQGDGELSGCEMRSVVKLSVQVLKGWTRGQNCPRVETPSRLVTVGIGSPAEAAQWQAIREMILWLEERHGWTKEDARRFLALTCDVRPGQMLVHPYTMRLIVAKEHLPH